MYKNVIDAHSKAAEIHIPQKPKKKQRIPWENNDVTEKREILKECHRQKVEKETRKNITKMKSAKKDLDKAYEAEQENYVKEKISEFEQAHNNQKSRLAWSIINEISGRKNKNTGQIKAKSPKERLKLWKNEFQNLLGNKPVIEEAPTLKIFDELPIKTDAFDMDDLEAAIRTLKNNKATGLDEIPAEVWKIGCLNDILLQISNKTYNGSAPDIWRSGGIIPLPKKGDLGLTKNYRGITLSVVAAKVYNKMLLNRIRPVLDPLLRKNQNGFREGRSTVAQILTIRRLIEGIKAKNLSATLIFVDFKKAFDSIHRGKLMEILKAYGIPQQVVSAIEVLYTNTVAKVISPDGDTDFFEVLAGVLQGDTLAPYLFVIALDYVMRTATKDEGAVGFTLREARGRRCPVEIICDTDFADDLALTSDTLEQAQLFLLKVESIAAQIGLYLNEDKTEYMSLNSPESQILTLKGKNIKEVNDFLYLGSWIESSKKDLNIRIGKAWTALIKMDKIWKSNLKKELKIGLFRATVESVLLYGSNSWTMTKEMERKINGTYTRLLRHVLNVSWRQHLTNRELYGNLPKLTDTICHRRVMFSGHCYRSSNEVVHQLLLWEPAHGKRSRGRPAKTYIEQLEEDTGIPREGIGRNMKDREQWKVIVKNVRPRSIR